MGQEKSTFSIADHLVSDEVVDEEICGVPRVAKGLGELQVFGLEFFFRGEEVLGGRNVTFSPCQIVHFAQVLEEVGVAPEVLVDLANVNNGRPGHLKPERLNDFVWDVGGANEEVVVGPASAGKLGDSEVLEFSEPGAEFPGEEGDFGPSGVEGFTRGSIKSRINCERKKTVGRRRGNTVREALGLGLCTGPATPFLAGKGKEKKEVQTDGKANKGLGVGAYAEKGIGPGGLRLNNVGGLGLRRLGGVVECVHRGRKLRCLPGPGHCD